MNDSDSDGGFAIGGSATLKSRTPRAKAAAKRNRPLATTSSKPIAIWLIMDSLISEASYVKARFAKSQDCDPHFEGEHYSIVGCMFIQYSLRKPTDEPTTDDMSFCQRVALKTRKYVSSVLGYTLN